jgi:hypothetical protein
VRRFYEILASRRLVGAEVIQQLAETYSTPKCDEVAYHVRVRDDSPEYAAIIKILNDAGCVPYRLGSKYGPGVYSHNANYEYEPEDYAQAFLYRAVCSRDMKHTFGRNQSGFIRIHRRQLKSKGDFLNAEFQMVVSDCLKQVLESHSFAGLAFRPTVLVRGESRDSLTELSWEDVRHHPFWELTSELTLPPLAHRQMRGGDTRSPQSSEWDQGVWHGGFRYDEGEYDGRPGFLRESISEMEPFDFAHTYEPYQASVELKGWHHRALLFSKKAYEFFSERFPKTYWWPFYLKDK